MPQFPIKDIPKYEALLETSKRYPAMDPLATATFLQLLVSWDELIRGVADTFRKHQISKGKFMVLMQLFNKVDGSSREISPAELANTINVTRATVTGLLDGLERDELVVRKQDENDRRMVLVSLTPAGVAMMDRFLPEHFGRIQELMSCLSTQEKNQLRELLTKVCDHIPTVVPYKDDKDDVDCDCSL